MLTYSGHSTLTIALRHEPYLHRCLKVFSGQVNLLVNQARQSVRRATMRNRDHRCKLRNGCRRQHSADADEAAERAVPSNLPVIPRIGGYEHSAVGQKADARSPMTYRFI